MRNPRGSFTSRGRTEGIAQNVISRCIEKSLSPAASTMARSESEPREKGRLTKNTAAGILMADAVLMVGATSPEDSAPSVMPPTAVGTAFAFSLDIFGGWGILATEPVRVAGTSVTSGDRLPAGSFSSVGDLGLLFVAEAHILAMDAETEGCVSASLVGVAGVGPVPAFLFVGLDACVFHCYTTGIATSENAYGRIDAHTTTNRGGSFLP